MKYALLLVFVFTTTIISAQEEPRRGNPDIAVLRNFVAELRQAGQIRGARLANADSDENSSSEEHSKYRKVKAFIVAPAAEPTEKPAHVESESPSPTPKYIPKYSPVATRQHPTTPYPPHASTYRYKYRPAYDIQRVNDGVGTILRGVGSARLSEILRGSFMFTRNEQVRSVANSVIDSIFGPRDPRLGKPNRNDGILFPLTGL